MDYLLNHDASYYDAVVLTMGADHTAPTKMLRDAGINKPILSFRYGVKVNRQIERVLCPSRAVLFDGGRDDIECLSAIKETISGFSNKIAIYGVGNLPRALFKQFPEITSNISYLIDHEVTQPVGGVDVITLEAFAGDAAALFLSTTSYFESLQIEAQVKAAGINVTIVKLYDVLLAMDCDVIPARVWLDPQSTIYPIEIPQIKLETQLDFALFDLPPRFYSMMPNGLGYVHNILEKMDISMQTMDLDIIFYHRYHMARILDGVDPVVSPSGYVMKQDPWAIDVIIDEWMKEEVLKYFEPNIEELVDEIIRTKPKIIGFSLHGTNLRITSDVVRRIKQNYPDVIIVVGGYDCIRPEFGSNLFSDFDYMVIFEAENSLAGLVVDLLSGKRPQNIPGIISKQDRPEIPFIPSSPFSELDSIDFPRYQWVDVNTYRNYNGHNQVPIVLSRGCRWSKCTFCAERFEWRRRTPGSVVDEIEWHVNRGRTTFVFNDSDLSGDPSAVRAICEMLISRGITDVSLSGQLRVQKGYSQEYFNILRKAGFSALTYGIDGWSKNTLKLHKKGYTLGMIEEVLIYTKNAGINASINLVVGIPHETEADIDETIMNIVKNKSNFNGIENINALMLSNGSVYWQKPEAFSIKFREDKSSLHKQHIKVIPTELWYSTAPYIDQHVRLDRVGRIIDAAREAGIRIGSYADWSMDKLETGQSKMLMLSGDV